jgi:hypothetical protein
MGYKVIEKQKLKMLLYKAFIMGKNDTSTKEMLEEITQMVERLK